MVCTARFACGSKGNILRTSLTGLSLNIFFSYSLSVIVLLIWMMLLLKEFRSSPLGPSLLVSSNGTLLLVTAEKAHEGRYSCTADNGVGRKLIKRVTLTVNGELLP